MTQDRPIDLLVDDDYHLGGWHDAGSVDGRDYSEVELHVAGRISTVPPFADRYSPRALPIARVALEALADYHVPAVPAVELEDLLGVIDARLAELRGTKRPSDMIRMAVAGGIDELMALRQIIQDGAQP